jgi:hypothetical protein
VQTAVVSPAAPSPVVRPAPANRRERWRRRGLLSIALAVTAAVYAPIIHSYFRSDDFLHLYDMVNRPLLDFLIKPHGGHLFFTRNAVFWLWHELFGVRASWYFALVLLNHVVNAWLLFGIVERVSGRTWLAWGAALLWGTAPIHGEVLGWYSVHGQVLLATAVLLLLRCVIEAADRDRPVSTRELVVWLLLLVAAGTCYGSGLGVALVFPVVAALLLPAPRRAVIVLVTLWFVVPLLFVADHWLWAHLAGEDFEAVPSFAPGPREWVSVGTLLLGMLGTGVKVVQFDPLAFGWQLPDPGESVALAAFVVLVVAALVAARSRERRLMLVFVLVALAMYGPIAAGRVGLARLLAFTGDQAAQPRHHYAGPLPLLLASCLAVHVLTRGRRIGESVRTFGLVAVVVLVIGGWLRGTRRLDLHEAARDETQVTVAAIRAAIAAAPPGADVVLRNRRFQSVGPLAPPVAFPGWAAVFTIFFPGNRVDGHRVYFVEPDPAVRSAAATGARTATLLVPPGGGGAPG